MNRSCACKPKFYFLAYIEIRNYCDDKPELAVKNSQPPAAGFLRKIGSSVELLCKAGYQPNAEGLLSATCVAASETNSGTWKSDNVCKCMIEFQFFNLTLWIFCFINRCGASKCANGIYFNVYILSTNGTFHLCSDNRLLWCESSRKLRKHRKSSWKWTC